ncbi:putative 26S proteasome non-ATPase regulatory subunit 12 [Fusarium oxysporum f. sp. albedinis]|nr:putative 26S proteasome non-ATPase regulatory subunit 12 [Fusarium oxysporum f. sp. albedinis]
MDRLSGWDGRDALAAGEKGEKRGDKGQPSPVQFSSSPAKDQGPISTGTEGSPLPPQRVLQRIRSDGRAVLLGNQTSVTRPVIRYRRV